MDTTSRNTLIPAFAVFLVLVTAILWWSASLASKTKNSNRAINRNRVACTQEAKLCPDGSSVGRTGPNCAFAPCPASTTNTAVSGGCVITGCSRQVCSDHEVVTTCIMLPEYSCYASATCERQTDGQCGWTTTTKLLDCLTLPQ